MKKKVLIVSHALELGGAERALIGLLESMDPERLDIDLFLLRHEGELMGMIPSYVNLLPEVPAYTVLARPMVTVLKEGHIFLTGARLAAKVCANCYAKKHAHRDSYVSLEYSHKFTCPLMPKIQPDVEYDLAISFLTPHYFVAQRVRAKKKIAWIHTDYSKIQINEKSELAMWRKYDHIASISDAVTDGFLKVFPSLRDKMILMKNILPVRLINQQVEAFSVESEMPDDSLRLLSVGRFCKAKNFDNVPGICSHLIEMGLNVRWYLIGFGGDEELIHQKIQEAAMEDHVIILGKKDNPYPYLKACDLYVQPSRYEGHCVTVCEAQLLGKPVVITNYATSASQLENGVDGIVVPMDNEGCVEGIVDLLKTPQRMRELSENCGKQDYSNAGEVEKIYRVMETQNG